MERDSRTVQEGDQVDSQLFRAAFVSGQQIYGKSAANTLQTESDKLHGILYLKEVQYLMKNIQQ